MKNKIAVVICLVLSLMLFAACQTKNYVSSEDKQESVVPTITVTGQGKMTVAPDKAVLNVGVRTQASTSEAASKENAEIMDTVKNALKKFDIKDEDMQTQNYYVYENVRYNDNSGQEKVTGYTVENSLRVTVYDLDNLGKITDAAVAAGANQYWGVYFGIKDPKSYDKELAKLSVEDAKAQAEAYAQALGKKLGDVISITDGSMINEPMVYVEDSKNALAEPDRESETTFEPGTLELSSNITIRFALG